LIWLFIINQVYDGKTDKALYSKATGIANLHNFTPGMKEKVRGNGLWGDHSR
jgi:hypothetical protein